MPSIVTAGLGFLTTNVSNLALVERVIMVQPWTGPSVLLIEARGIAVLARYTDRPTTS